MARAVRGSRDRLVVSGTGRGQGVLTVLCFYSQSIGVLSLGVSLPACYMDWDTTVESGRKRHWV